jgi:hypothetical protein
MPPVISTIEDTVAAIVSGSPADLRALLARAVTGEGGSADAAFATLFWGRWCRHANLHEDYLAQLAPLRDALTRLDPCLWVTDPTHPVWELLALLRRAGSGYQPELGRAAGKILADWAAVLQSLAANADWSSALQPARHQWQQEREKLDRLEQRLIDSQRGQLRSRRAQQLAARELNRAMGGKIFSADMANLLQHDWYRELQWCALQWGAASEQWQHWVELTRRLVESVQSPGDDVEARQRLYGLIPEVEAQLRAALLERAHDLGAVDQLLARVEREHVALLKSQPLPSAPFALIASDDPWASNAMTMSRDLLQRAAELVVGSEYRVREGEQELRVRLALKMDDPDQLLFVNRLGVKVLQKSFEEFAYWLATGVAEPLPDPTDSPQVLQLLLRQLLARDAQQQRAREDVREREQAELQRRHAAREKALAEARAIADARAQSARAAAEQAREQEQQRRRARSDAEFRGDDAQRLRQARQTAAALPIGSWVELCDELGVAQRVRLAVKLSASGKLIFVDREGARRADCEREEFALRLLDGSACVLEQGPQFEDALARVVDSLRRDRAKRGE